MNNISDKIRPLFPVLNFSSATKRFAYLDSAATTLKPQKVIDALVYYYSHLSVNVHRGVYKLSAEASDLYEQTRKKTAKFINSVSSDEIIFTSGTTASLNLLAYSFLRPILKSGDEVIITEMEHHSNIIPWQMMCKEKGATLKVVRINDKGELDLEHFHELLNDKVVLVACSYVSNTLGTINPIKDIVAAAHAKNIPVAIDAAQAMVHTKIDVQDLDADFVTFSAHKMFGPTGLGVLYGKRKFLEKMPPFMFGGNMIKTVSFENTEFADIPQKFEAGTPPIAEVIAFGAALDFLNQFKFEDIQAQEQKIKSYANEQLPKIVGLRIIGNAEKKIPLYSLVIDGIHPHDLGTVLDEANIAVRTGLHCTEPLMRRMKVQGTTRASFSIYNDIDDVDQLVDGIKYAQKVFGL